MFKWAPGYCFKADLKDCEPQVQKVTHDVFVYLLFDSLLPFLYQVTIKTANKARINDFLPPCDTDEFLMCFTFLACWDLCLSSSFIAGQSHQSAGSWYHIWCGSSFPKQPTVIKSKTTQMIRTRKRMMALQTMVSVKHKQMHMHRHILTSHFKTRGGTFNSHRTVTYLRLLWILSMETM